MEREGKKKTRKGKIRMVLILTWNGCVRSDWVNRVARVSTLETFLHLSNRPLFEKVLWPEFPPFSGDYNFLMKLRKGLRNEKLLFKLETYVDHQSPGRVFVDRLWIRSHNVALAALGMSNIILHLCYKFRFTLSKHKTHFITPGTRLFLARTFKAKS